MILKIIRLIKIYIILKFSMKKTSNYFGKVKKTAE